MRATNYVHIMYYELHHLTLINTIDDIESVGGGILMSPRWGFSPALDIFYSNVIPMGLFETWRTEVCSQPGTTPHTACYNLHHLTLFT